MQTKAGIFDTIMKWVRSETGYVVIRGNGKGPRPPRPYASLLFTNPSIPLGQPQTNLSEGFDPQDPDTWVVTVEGMKKAIASINIFGENACDTLSQVRDSLYHPDVLEMFERADIAVIDDSGVNDLSGLLETEYEERGQLELVISFVAGADVDVGTIEQITVGGAIDGRPVTAKIN